MKNLKANLMQSQFNCQVKCFTFLKQEVVLSHYHIYLKKQIFQTYISTRDY